MSGGWSGEEGEVDFNEWLVDVGRKSDEWRSRWLKGEWISRKSILCNAKNSWHC